MDLFAKYNAIAGALRGQLCDLELVTRLHLADGTTQETTNVRRAVCKKATRKKNVTVLSFADIDTEALQQAFPFEQFTVADFPGLFVDHVGWRIPQGVGTVVKVPLAWISAAGGVWQYAGPKILDPANPTYATVLAVYRGTQAGQGALVSSSEYTVSSAVGASTGVRVLSVNFTREQRDFQGRPYLLEADVLLAGSRSPADEIKRLLALYGITADPASFAAAAAADVAAGFAVDALYGSADKARTGAAIINDLLNVARGWLSLSSAAGWVIVQDVARAASAQFDTAADLLEIDEYGDGDIEKTVTLDYRPKRSGEEDYAGSLSRTTAGATGERRIRSPYIRDHQVADRLLSYWQKRLNTLRVASGTIHAAQQANGDRITVADLVSWVGSKDFIITGISRPADSNRVTLREYDASIYTYTAGTLPADATNGYTPDYSYTPPLAPTSLAVISQGTLANTDGSVKAYALIRAVPPAVNWQRLMVQVQDTTTNEIYQAQLQLNAGNYEATIPNLRPNRAHQVIAWAVNSNNLDGVPTAAVPFTSANATIALGTPTVTLTQKQSFEVNIDLSAIADVSGQPKFRRYVLFEKVGAGAMTEVQRTPDRTLKRTVNHGTAYQYMAHSEDVNGNESVDSAIASITPAAVITDSWITPTGITGTSIADGSINRGRGTTATGSISGTIVNLDTLTMTSGQVFTYFPAVGGGSAVNVYMMALGTTGGSDIMGFRLFNNSGANQSYSVLYRYVQP